MYLAACAAALAVAAGVGSWQVARHGQGSDKATTAGQTQSQTQTQTQENETGASSLPPATANSAVTTTSNAVYLDLVASPEQAQMLQRAAIDTIGYLPTNETLMPVGPEISVANVLATLELENQTRVSRGLPPIQVVDLR
jgi:hypothetical protein